jgi:hypothetical protein
MEDEGRWTPRGVIVSAGGFFAAGRLSEDRSPWVSTR